MLIDIDDVGVDEDAMLSQLQDDQALLKSVLTLVLFDRSPGAAFSHVASLPERSAAICGMIVLESLSPWVFNSPLTMLSLGHATALASGSEEEQRNVIAELCMYAARVSGGKPVAGR